MRSRERLTKIQAATRLDHLSDQSLVRDVRSSSTKGKKQRAIEKPKLEFKETMKKKNAEKLERPTEAAMPCKLKTFRHRETCGKSDVREGKHAS